MKQQGIYPAIVLISVGGYFFLQQYPIPFAAQILTWPTLLLLIGASFLAQSYLGKEHSLLLPGWILAGLAIHFHGLSLIAKWPSHWGVFTFILGVSFLLLYIKTRKEGLLFGSIFVLVSLLMFTSMNPFSYFEQLSSFLGSLWPLVLIAIGIFLLAKRK